MKTYQDLLKCGADTRLIGLFCREAVDDFRGTMDYKNARDGEAYYNKHNLTIEKFQKYLYTVSGRQVEDVFSANYKLKTLFFRRMIIQQVQYVLGNGLILQNPKNKEKLGRRFDFMLQTAAKRAMASGKAFGFWNLDHLEVFGYADTPAEPGFCPLYDENNAKLMAGIRFWFRTVDNGTVFRATLYEEDGITEFMQKDSEEVQVLTPKKAYKTKVIKSQLGGTEAVMDENYSALPIVPLYSNDSHESELVGIRECIDCYDYIKSGLANDIDDTAGFYWILKNTGGMDDVDLAQFMQKMKTVKAAVVDGDDNVDAEAHTLEVPFEARKAMLEILKTDIYDDFQSLNVKDLSASAKTTQEIKAAYQSQDDKCADFEYYLLDFVQRILELAQIDDEPSFVWNKVVNQAEQTQTVMMAAQYLDDETIIKLLPFLTPEQADEVIRKRKSEDLLRFNDLGEEDTDEDDKVAKKGSQSATGVSEEEDE